MKTNLYFLMAACICTAWMCAGCGSDDNNELPATSFVIDAKVENGNAYNSSVDEVRWEVSLHNETVILASAPYVNGGFTITLPDVVDDKYLTPSAMMEQTLEGITVSNKQVKGIGLYLEAFKSNTYEGYFFYGKDLDEFNLPATTAEIVYVDSDCTIKGTASFSEGALTTTLTADLTYKKGWNISYITANNSTRNITSTSAKPNGLKWYCTAATIIPPVYAVPRKPLLFNENSQ